MTIPRFLAAKKNGRKLTMLTAYDFLLAGLFDEMGVDSLLVGDSLGMVVQGHESTLPVTLDQIIYHAEIVARATKFALVIADMPFMTFQESPTQAIRNAGRILKETGVGAVKLEGGANHAKTIEALTNCDLPVMAHIGMKPQSIRKMGTMAKIARDEKQLLADARAAEQAGAFGVILELMPQQVAQTITAEIGIPTIGIGAGPHCDGQVLVSYDMLGLTSGFEPKFLKRYADLKSTIATAAQRYIREVTTGEFPTADHSH
ncbi:MAG: 3-methyl-2-oxobutanoate hydroxymethyltransferase, partial [Planctomycetaceae bacterium]|nr:3-methyl-2-oxobutanoate hydroxymethyltransferase [Planctomycetaceae bacterium]